MLVSPIAAPITWATSLLLLQKCHPGCRQDVVPLGASLQMDRHYSWFTCCFRALICNQGKITPLGYPVFLPLSVGHYKFTCMNIFSSLAGAVIIICHVSSALGYANYAIPFMIHCSENLKLLYIYREFRIISGFASGCVPECPITWSTSGCI